MMSTTVIAVHRGSLAEGKSTIYYEGDDVAATP